MQLMNVGQAKKSIKNGGSISTSGGRVSLTTRGGKRYGLREPGKVADFWRGRFGEPINVDNFIAMEPPPFRE